MSTLQDKPLMRLHPHQDNILVEFGGDLVVLGRTRRVAFARHTASAGFVKKAMGG
jgi:hypothetical protein